MLRKLLMVTALAGPALSPAPGCSHADEQPHEQFTARGQIVAVRPDALDIHHERIAAMRGIDGQVHPMDSMTMPFGIPDRLGESLRTTPLAVGDAVTFTFEVHRESAPILRLTSIEKLPAGTRLELP